MTKIMTLLVAAEHIENMDDTFTMTYDIIAPLIDAEASRAGFEEGETVPLKDLMYGIALPSGADATTAIAIYLCGSEDEFVKLMNEKAEELGLENTHFTTPAVCMTRILQHRHRHCHADERCDGKRHLP